MLRAGTMEVAAMADSYTPYWGLTKPEVGSSRDTWGTKLNGDLDVLDTLLQALQPIGAMIDFAGANAPTGWLLCDGTLYTKTAYPRLFAVIGNRYGGDGVSTFAVPDLRARTTTGVGSTTGDLGTAIGFSLGERIGDLLYPIQQVNFPSAMTVTTNTVGGHTHPGSASGVAGAHQHAGSTDTTGAHSHNFVGVNFHNGGQDVQGGFDSGINNNSFTTTAGEHSHNILTDYRGDHTHTLAITSDGAHAHTFGLGGSDVWLRIQPATLGSTKLICCGPPSMQTVMAALASGGMARLMASPLRGVH
jgi:microcystin-dependent protein